MRKPYGAILIASILLTVIFFVTEDRPAYITFKEDEGDMLFWAVVYIAMFFCTFSGLYLLFKKKRGESEWTKRK